MTKRKTAEAEGADGALTPTIDPPVEATDFETDMRAYDRLCAANDLLREVLTHTHATARLPADLLRRIQEAVS